MKVKCFYGNYDGRRRGMVVANSQKKAAEVAQTSLYYFRDYWSEGQWPKDFIPKPFTLYLSNFSQDDKWIEKEAK